MSDSNVCFAAEKADSMLAEGTTCDGHRHINDVYSRLGRGYVAPISGMDALGCEAFDAISDLPGICLVLLSTTT